jgi:hypothetical protein
MEALPPFTVYRAHWEDPLTRFFEQLFGALAWNIIALSDGQQTVWYSYFHPYPMIITNDNDDPLSHGWQTSIQFARVPQTQVLILEHQKVDMYEVLENYNTPAESTGLQFISLNLQCSIQALIDLPYQTFVHPPYPASNMIALDSPLPPIMVSNISKYYRKGAAALVKLAVEQPSWYQKCLAFQPVDSKWWYHLTEQHHQLLTVLEQGLQTGIIAAESLIPLISNIPLAQPAHDLPLTLNITQPQSLAVVTVPEKYVTAHYKELTNLISQINDPQAVHLPISGLLNTAQQVFDHLQKNLHRMTKEYPMLSTFVGHRLLRIQGDSLIHLQGPYILSSLNSGTYPLVLDGYTTNLEDYTKEQLQSILHYVNGLQDSDGNGSGKYTILQNRIIWTLAKTPHKTSSNSARKDDPSE